MRCYEGKRLVTSTSVVLSYTELSAIIDLDCVTNSIFIVDRVLNEVDSFNTV